MNIFFNERRFWRNALERLIDIALFLSERNLAFRGSEEVLGSPHNGNFPGILELLARRDPILKELQDTIKNKNTKDHYLSPTIQTELIESEMESGRVGSARTLPEPEEVSPNPTRNRSLIRKPDLAQQ